MRAAAVPVADVGDIDSTNSEAMRRISRGEMGPLWLLARSQSAGKGRSGRLWTSQPGNFYGSLILPVDCPRAAASQISLITGIAVIDALVERAGRPVDGLRLKWPNDVLLNGGKLAGILPESTSGRDGSLVAVLGIGINLSAPPQDIGRPVAAFSLAGEAVKAAELVAPLSHWLLHWLSLWERGDNFGVVRDAWQARAGALGESIAVNTGQGPVFGLYRGLDDDGALLMQGTDGSMRRMTFGDVMLAGEY